MVRLIIDPDEKEKIAAFILSSLPGWFGLPESTRKYIVNSREMPFWAYYSEDNVQGFITLNKTGGTAAEIYVMGVLPQNHHKGIGTALWESFLDYARKSGCEYVQVKTVQTGRYAEYDQTNEFYRHLGFRELECFPALWDEWNPCQIYVKYIGSADPG